MKGRLVHLRVPERLLEEIEKACVEFHYQSASDFLRESARSHLHELDKRNALKKLKSMKAEKLKEKEFNQLIELEMEDEEKNKLSYYS